jgi:hypothetical protein
MPQLTPRRRFPSRCIVATLAVVVAGLGIARNVQTARADDPNRFADRIQDCKNNSGNTLNDLDQMLADLQNEPDLTQSDVPLYKAYMQSVSNKFLDAAAAFAKGDEASGNKLNEEAHRMYDQAAMLHMRNNFRGQERLLLMTQDDFDNIPNYTAPSFRTYYVRTFEYRKRSVEACERLCDALVPGADPQMISDLRDALEVAMTESDCASRVADWSRDDSFLTEHPQVTSSDISQTMQQLVQARDKIITNYRQMRAAERQTDKLNDQYGVLQRQRDAAINAEQQAHP